MARETQSTNSLSRDFLQWRPGFRLVSESCGANLVCSITAGQTISGPFSLTRCSISRPCVPLVRCHPVKQAPRMNTLACCAATTLLALPHSYVRFYTWSECQKESRGAFLILYIWRKDRKEETLLECLPNSTPKSWCVHAFLFEVCETPIQSFVERPSVFIIRPQARKWCLRLWEMAGKSVGPNPAFISASYPNTLNIMGLI